jgi:hypothetical protein
MKKENHLTNITIVSIFVAVVFLPIFAHMLPLNGLQPLEEKRRLASLSSAHVTLKRLAHFPREFEAYYNDHFTFRSSLIRFYNKFKLMVFDESPREDVILGDDGWMFWAGDLVLEDVFALDPFTQEELELLREIIEGKRDWLAERKATYVFLVTPNKHTLYREFMPEDYRRLSGPSRFDQLIAYLKEHSDIDLIDLREPLQKLNNQYTLYYRTDTHWNKVGGFFAYRHIIHELNQRLPNWNAVPRDISEYTITTTTDKGGDIAKVLALEDSHKEKYYHFQPHFESCLVRADAPEYLGREWQHRAPVIYNCEGASGKMVIFHDSYIGGLEPFLPEHFKRSVFLWMYHHDFNTLKQVVEAEHPDLVIEQIQERLLEYIYLEEKFPGKSWERQFSESTETILHVTPSSPAESFSQLKEMKISPSADGFILKTFDRKARLELPKVNKHSTPRSVIRISITSPEETELQIQYHLTEKDDQWSIDRKAYLKKGKNVVYLGIPNYNFSGRLRLRPGRIPHTYILHNVEIRSAS